MKHTKPILDLKDVWKVYLAGDIEVPAIRGVSLEVEAGDYVSINGPSGSGKSTLLNMIGCLDTPTDGKIRLGGYDIETLSEDELAAVRRKLVGFVFQTFNLMPSLSALENVALPMRFDGFSRKEAEEKARILLELVNLEHRLRNKPGEMSGGERQRVAIARALINDPSIILADEPTGNLDTTSGAKVIDMLERLNAQGMTLIIITHDPELSERAEKRLHIVDGKLTSDYKTKRKEIYSQILKCKGPKK